MKLITAIVFLAITQLVFIARAEIVYSGEVTGDPTEWTSSSNAYIGYRGTGTLSVNDGDDIISKTGQIGCYGEGKVNISGHGSSWQMPGNIYVGYMRQPTRT